MAERKLGSQMHDLKVEVHEPRILLVSSLVDPH